MAEVTLKGAFIIQVEAEKVFSGSCYFDRVAVAEQLQPKRSPSTASGLVPCLSKRRRGSKLATGGSVGIRQEILYGAWVSQAHRGRRSSSSSANLRILSSKSMALLSRSFASSMRPVTLAQHASLKKINGSLGCHSRDLERTASICPTCPSCLTA
jgi:hypothetical protein